ncbi:SDR family oxidoreductase [Ammoniphilus sp. 3BR4]|uniref:SDR family oxidoreductase n=1 Tax=Ammoniphilus sp. 3BR4 TaxID=3158265 RepID=UPI00346525C1
MQAKNTNPPIAFITGASSGFGLLATVALAKEGYRVVATMRNLERKALLEQAIKKEGLYACVEIYEMDVTDSLQIQEIVRQVIDRNGRVDLLVNNAGYASAGFVEEVDLEEWRRQFDTNFFGVVSLTQAILPFMRKQRQGMIINISSISGRMGFPALGPYVASKFALEGFSETLRLEMAPFGVRVVLIEPGSFKTEIWGKGVDSADFSMPSPYQRLKELIRREVEQTSRTAGNPKEVIDLILHVAKSKAPKLRYPIGKGVKISLAFKSIAPWNWLERIVTKRFKE